MAGGHGATGESQTRLHIGDATGARATRTDVDCLSEGPTLTGRGLLAAVAAWVLQLPLLFLFSFLIPLRLFGLVGFGICCRSVHSLARCVSLASRAAFVSRCPTFSSSSLFLHHVGCCCFIGQGHGDSDAHQKCKQNNEGIEQRRKAMLSMKNGSHDRRR
jgi:hypothetical protein